MLDVSPLPDAAHRIEVALDDLGRVASAARHGDQLVAVIVDAHAAGFRRLLAVADDPAVLTGDAELGEVLWVHEGAGDGAAIETMGTRVDTLRGAIEQCGVPGLAGAADELIDVVTALHGWALGRAIELLHESGQHDAIRAALADELVAALLLAHGMHPEPLADRVERVLAACRTTLGPAGGDVALVSATEADARVVLGISGGDATQRWRTRLTVERALRELVADIVDLQIDGADAEPRGTPSPTIIPLTSIGRRRSARWTELPAATALAPGDVVQLVHEGRKLVACRLGDDVYVAPDPFTTNTLRIVATDPPTVESGDGSRLVLSDPYPTHSDDGVLEVLL
jgi:hypothetical protein